MKPWERVHAAMLQREFHEVDPDGLGYKAYDGDLKIGADRVPVRLIFLDDKFLKMPHLLIRDLPKWLPKSSAHLFGVDMPSLCYPGRETAFMNRYEAGEHSLGILDASAELLDTLKRTGGAPQDIINEFASYWGGYVYFDLRDSEQNGLVHGALRSDRGLAGLITTAARRSDFDQIVDPATWESASAFFADLDGIPLVPTNGNWPPETFGALRDWLKSNSDQGYKALRDAIGWMHDEKRNAAFITFRTPTTWFGFSVSLPPMYIDVKKIPKRHSFIGLVLGQRMESVPILRHVASRVDADYVVTRNLPDGVKPLTGLKILLVGVGAIGGYLADSLVRVGAGNGSGVLVMADPDRFSAGNIGRHRLTYGAIGRYKVDAMADELRGVLPWVNVLPIHESVLDIGPLKDFDLVIDATGVRPLSLELNELYLARNIKKLISVWIFNNGMSVHGLICSDRAKGCRQCLYTAGDQKAYFPDAPSNETFNMGRGCDLAYLPYSAAPALAATTLGLQAALDLINDSAQLNYRVSVLDRKSRDIKDKSLDKIKGCPACSQ